MTHRIETLAIHAGQAPDPSTGAVVAPVVLASTYLAETFDQRGEFEYGRVDNPNRRALEACVAALEGASHGLAFASGCAAMDAVMRLLAPGDHVVASSDIYGGTYRLLQEVASKTGVNTTWSDLRDPSQLAGAIQPNTKIVWVETPSNPTLQILDLAALCEASGDALVVVDNTFATPILQRPLELGVDIVVHSTTKYINGHSDVIGGLVVTNRTDVQKRLRLIQVAAGAVPSPFDCYLTVRGLKTLAVRMQRHCDNALSLAQWLEQRAEVERVYYPGLDAHPGHSLAKSQMKGGFGGVVSVELKADLQSAHAFMSKLSLFHIAGSLGGVESLIESPALLSHATIPREERVAMGVTDGLVRMSVGIEAIADLQADVEQALKVVA